MASFCSGVRFASHGRIHLATHRTTPRLRRGRIRVFIRRRLGNPVQRGRVACTVYAFFVARVAVRAIVIDFSMCDGWLMRMPPTVFPPPNLTFIEEKVISPNSAPLTPNPLKGSAWTAWLVGLPSSPAKWMATG